MCEWANRLIVFNKLRHVKCCGPPAAANHRGSSNSQDELQEAKWVVGEIEARIREDKRNRPQDFAILCRTNEQPGAFEMELRRAKIPYVLLGGMSFYDRKEVRDILAYLKVLVDPGDEASLRRIINLPARGISQATVNRLMEDAVQRAKPLCHVSLCASQIAGLSAAAADAVGRFCALVERFRQLAKERSPSEVVSRLIREIAYRDELVRLYPEANDQQSRWAAVEELVNAVAGYSKRAAKPTIAGFLQEVALTGSEADRDRELEAERNAVALMTLHAAKGLEFLEVYMVGMEEGTLPHHRSVAEAGAAVDEERRLCYVGVTRAKCRLTLTMALSRRKWGKSRPTQPSRFLYELTGRADNPNYLAAKRRSKRLHGPHVAAEKASGFDFFRPARQNRARLAAKTRRLHSDP